MRLLDEPMPRPAAWPHATLITFVTDRPGTTAATRSMRARSQRELGLAAAEHFETGLAERRSTGISTTRVGADAVADGSAIASDRGLAAAREGGRA